MLQEICAHLKIDISHHLEIKGIDKTRVKAQIKELKARRQAALEAKDRVAVKRARRRISRLGS